ncbi:MAG: MFS transporter [Pseudomonadota bacterium]
MLHFTSPYHRRLTWRYFALFVAIGLMGGLLGPALPHLAAMTNASMSQIAVLFTARALGNMAGALTTGVLIDRYSGHRVLLGMAMLGALGLLITPFSPSLALLTGMMGILGFAEVSLNAGGNTLLLWLHKESSGPQVSALHFCFGLGNMLTPLLIMLALAMTGQFQWAFWIVASCLLMVIVPISRSPSPGKPHADTTLGTHHLTKHRDPVLLGLLMLMFSLYVGIEITFAGWITAYGVLSGSPSAQAALLATLFWLALSAGRLLAIPLLRWHSPWRVLVGCLLLGMATALALHAHWVPLELGALLFGLAASAFFPTLFTLSNNVMEIRGRTTGAIFMAASVGALIIPTVTGPLLDRLGAGAFPPLLGGLLLLLSMGLLALALRLRQLALKPVLAFE